MNKKSFLPVLVLVPALALAQQSSEELEAALATATGQERLDVLVKLTTVYREDDKSARSVELGQEALELLRSYPDRRWRLKVLNSLSRAHILLGEYETARRLSSQAGELARRLNDKSELAYSFRSIGQIHRSFNAYEKALDAYRRAIELYTEIDKNPELGDALNDVGVVHWFLGDYPAALEYFIEARKEYEEAGDLQRIAAILNNTGMIHRKLQQSSRALELYHEALGLRRQVGPKGALANVLNNIGNVHVDIGEPAQALEYLLEALNVGLIDRNGYANTLINVGVAYEHLGDLDQAIDYFRQAIDAKETLGDQVGVAQALNSVGGIERKRGDLTSALRTLQDSLSITQELDANEEIRSAQLELSNVYAEMGRYREALEAFKRFEEMKSEIFNQENSKNIAEMEARFESDRKEKEIEILRQQQAIDGLELKRQTIARRALYGGLVLLSLVVGLLYNRYRMRMRDVIERRRLEAERIRQEARETYVAELEAKKAEVETRNAEMERFVYTVSHDLKSPLVTIRGFLGLVEQEALTGDTDRMKADLARINAAAARMARLLDELLQLSRIGRVVNEWQEIELGALVDEVMEQLTSQITERGVDVVIAPDLPRISGDRVRLLEVLQNLIENAVKFSGDRLRPRVDVGSRLDGSETVIFVRDNGLGIDPRYHQQIFGLFKRLDTEIDGTGVGLALVKRIIEVHGGRIWVESEGAGRGSTFCFTLGSRADSPESDFSKLAPALADASEQAAI